MSDLTRYNGNFLNFADQEFDFHASFRKQFSGSLAGIDLQVGCPVGIFASQDDSILVEIDTDKPSNFSVTESSGTIVIEQKTPGGGNVTVINGVTVMGGNVSMINGRIFVDGKEYNPNQPQEEIYPHKIRIFAPKFLDLDANLSGFSVLASKVIFNKSRVKVSGQATVGVATKHLNLKLSGQGNNFVVLQGGELTAKVSGQGQIRAKGEYSEVEASVSGMGSVATEGVCHGSYHANVSGMGNITHSGTVKGRVRKSVTGMGSINI